jgi:hypothetical protein
VACAAALGRSTLGKTVKHKAATKARHAADIDLLKGSLYGVILYVFSWPGAAWRF